MKIIHAMINSDENELSGSGLVEYNLLENIILLYYLASLAYRELGEIEMFANKIMKKS